MRIGKVVRAHGVRGEVAIRPDEPGSRSLLLQKEVFLRNASGSVEVKRIEAVRQSPSVLLLRLEGITSRNQAEELRGREVLLPRSRLPPAEEGELYAADLVGLEVKTPSGEVLGRVEELFEAGAVPVLEVRGARSMQVPMVSEFVKKIDLTAGEIVVEPPKEDES
jgi:16S rRNA processing protein RimM